MRKFLRPGQFYASRRPVMTETLVGSCVTVCLYNTEGGFGAMNHFLRDRPRNESDPEVGTYGTTATRKIVNAMLKIDPEPRHYEASIFGGAAVLKSPNTDGSIGDGNVAAALEVLKAAGIRVVRQEVGGTRGRRVRFNTHTGQIECRFAGDIPRKKIPQRAE
ncbi:MAG TPA: chemotaxis protein CheD [Sedimentisphaerales bacterium]|nr:chemotaxis protein CheD [Sedimentisphaerales bacterium]HRS09454.1 chemotaxis protein CheD [Sedimentisphaerales bacterium]HRV46151.1 chemotaxis protein CheD [Sedimentisphaerales bacterium]